MSKKRSLSAGVAPRKAPATDRTGPGSRRNEDSPQALLLTTSGATSMRARASKKRSLSAGVAPLDHRFCDVRYGISRRNEASPQALLPRVLRRSTRMAACRRNEASPQALLRRRRARRGSSCDGSKKRSLSAGVASTPTSRRPIAPVAVEETRRRCSEPGSQRIADRYPVEETKPLRRRCSRAAAVEGPVRERVEETKPLRRRCSRFGQALVRRGVARRRNEASPQALLHAANHANHAKSKKRSLSAGVAP